MLMMVISGGAEEKLHKTVNVINEQLKEITVKINTVKAKTMTTDVMQ